MKKHIHLFSRLSIIFAIVVGVFLAAVPGFAVSDQGTGSKDSQNSSFVSSKVGLIPIDIKEVVRPPEEYVGPGEPRYSGGVIIIKLKDNASLSTITNDLQVCSTQPVFEYVSRLGEKSRLSIETRGLDRVHVVQLESGVSVESMLGKYRKDPEVEYAQPNYIYEPDRVPNDPLYGNQYAHQLTLAGAAWDMTTGSQNVVIAVIGIGVDIDHPDLVANTWFNPGEVANNGLDDEGNGYIDDVNGWNFYNDNNNPRPAGDDHETRVAGVSAGVGNNNIGICGVTWNSKIMPLRVGYTSGDVAAAVEYARANGAHIINMSFGNYDKEKYGDLLVKEMLDDAYEDGILLVATAGNDKIDTNRFPAALYNVMAVGASNQYDHHALWNGGYTGSNFGPWVDIAAPGSSIISTIPGGGYGYANGTSFSAPYVSGLGALLFSHAPTLTNIEVRAVLENTTDPIETGAGYIYVGGRVNAWEALSGANLSYPLGEIVTPANKDVIPGDTNPVPLTLFAHGDHYQVDYRAYNQEQWTSIGNGDPGGDAGEDGLIYLGFNSPGSGTFFLRLTVTAGGGTHTDTKMFGIEGEYQEDWPKVLPGVKRFIMSTAICMDIDEDGKNEIIQSSYGDSADGYTYIWNEDGTDLDGWPQRLGSDPSCSVSAVGDVDGDGDYEVVTTTYYGGQVYVWHWQNGELLAGDWPKAFGYSIRANPVLADLDGDGDAEIIVAVGDPDDIYDGIHVFQHDGTPVWTYTAENVQGPMAAADLDGDGDIEIAFSSYTETFVLDHEGNVAGHWSGGSHKSVIITDLENDGGLEIIAVNRSNSAIRALSLVSGVVWEAPLAEMGSYGAASAGDLDGDGFPEIFLSNRVVNKVNNKIYAWDHEGSPLMALDFPKDTLGTFFQNAPTIGDINGDGQKELVVGSSTGLLFAWDRFGNLVDTFPRVPGRDGIFTTAVMGDLDRDGDIEIMLGAQPPHYQDGGVFYVWDLPGAYNPDAVDWGMYRHDPQGSGCTLKTPKLSPLDIPAAIHAGETLQFQLTASNPDDLTLQFYVRQMPGGASFDAQTRTFSWTPTLDQVDETYKFYLFLTDGVRQDHKPVSITVLRPVAEITGLYVRNCGSYIQVYWSYDFQDVHHFKLQWSTDSEFNTLTGEYAYIGPERSWVNVMDYQLEGIGKTYYFRIAVCDDNQGEYWSEVKSVNYIETVPVITYLVNMGSYIKVYWSYACEAHHYKLQWSTDSEFNTLTGEIPYIGGSLWWVNIMDYLLDGTGKTYYFRIAACEENSCGFWSGTKSIYY